MKKLILAYSIFFSIGCGSDFNEKQILGKYVPVNYQNTYDTIWLMEDSTYLRKLYDKNKILVLFQRAKFEYLGGNIIQLYSVFENYDRDLVLYPELSIDTMGGMQCELLIYNQAIHFCIGMQPDLREFCYKKIQ